MDKRISLFAGIWLFCSLTTIYKARAQHRAGLTGTGLTNATLTCKTLLEELTDRSAIAGYQGGKWSLHHASSYDRHSVAKDREGWYANNDWDNYIRKESNRGRVEYVVLDTDGPGVITRFWTGGHPNKKAHLRFYVDGKSEPFWDADHTGALIGHNIAIGAPLSQRSVEQDSLHINEGAQPGHNLYAPIPFAHHIKITYDRPPGGADNGFWYNIDYRLYQPGTPVESFSARSASIYAAEFRKANKELQDFMDKSVLEAVVPGEKSIKDLVFSLGPGASKTIEWERGKQETKGLPNGGSIRKILLSLAATDHAREVNFDDAAENLWLEVDFDGRRCVSAPVGFFFGSGDQMITSEDWYSKCDSLGNMAAYWLMPYRQGAIVRLINKSKNTIDGALHISTGDWSWNSSSQYFHADFKRMDHFMTQKTIGQDFTYLDLPGKTGTYVGDRLQVYKPVGGWWGEGDEKIYVDGSTFPDDFGTGSEDYYGYAWGHPETFTHIFNAQPLGDANLGDRGGTTVNSRLRGLDAIPFHHDFRFDMESWNWHGGPVNFDWICFWYERPKMEEAQTRPAAKDALATNRSAGKKKALRNPALVWEDLPFLRPGVQTGSHTSKNPFNRTVQDFLNYTARDGKDFEMANVRGRSGMLVHSWFAFLEKDDKGTLKLYDGQTTRPLYSMPFVKYFDTSDHFSATHYAHLLWETRENIWWAFPCLPFNRAFKATSSAWPEWYQLTWQTYREDRFSEKLNRVQLEEIDRKMQQPPGSFPGADPGNQQDKETISLDAAEPKSVFKSGQPGVIRQFRLEVPEIKDSTDLDSLFIRITTDRRVTAWLPLPFFFGSYTGTDRNHARGMPAGFDGRGFYNFFPMPFWESLNIELENRNRKKTSRRIDIRSQVDWSDTNPYPRASTGVFTVQYNPPTPVGAGQPDFINLSVKGSGIMVGAVSKLTGAIEANFSVFVDGSRTPAIESTGGEDYFNHSYGIHPGFTRPFSGGLATDIGYRFHIIDYIPFSNSLIFTQDHAEYQAHDKDGVFNSAVFYYYNPDQELVMTDSLDIGDHGSETGHAYHCKGPLNRLKTDTAFYEGYYSEPITDAGRWTNGESRFTVSVDPSNDGVRIRKRIDQTAYHQALKVYVDGVPAGEWFEQGANYYLNRRLYYNDSLPDWKKGDLNARFRDTEFEIPGRLTRGKSVLSIRIETVGSLAVDAKDAGLTNEYHYWIYSYLTPGI